MAMAHHQSIYVGVLLTGMVLIPEGAVLSFVQAGEAAVQAGDLTVGDWREDAEEFTTDELKIITPQSKKTTLYLSIRPYYTSPGSV